jgi:hypothetical protein
VQRRLDVQCHLGGHARQRFHQEVGCSHPGLDRAEGVLDCLASPTHGLRILAQARFGEMLQNRPPATMPDEGRQPTEERIQDSVARVAMIERSVLVLLVVGLLIGVLAVVKPFTTAILFDAALATAAWPMRQARVRRRLGHGPAAAAC